MVTTIAVALTVAMATLAPPVTPGVKDRVRVAALSGRVIFNGSEPAAEPLNMNSEPYCREAQGANTTRKRVRVGAQNGLADVIVHVKGVRPASSAAPSQPVVLDQKNCLYDPNVLAVRVGQPFVIQNSDAVLHNVHAFPKKSPAFNLGQPMKGMKATRRFSAPELGVKVKCDIHEWMDATVAVFDHEFYAISAADGSFSIQTLPAGDYEIEAWHPTLGTRTQRIKVGTEPAAVTFTFGNP